MAPENDGGAIGNAGGSGTDQRPAWMDSLPDAHKQNEAFKAFKEPAEAWNKFDSLLKAEGSSVVIPGDKATDAERAAFFGKIGRPETPDKYSITKPENLPETVTYNPEIEAAAKEVFHKAGLSDAQAKQLYGWFFQTVAAGEAARTAEEVKATETAVNSLKDEWKGDEFKINSELAARAFKKFGGDKPEVEAFIRDSKINGVSLGDHPMFLRVFAAIGKAIADDSLNTGRGGGGGELSDEEKAKARFPKTTFPKT